MSLVLYENLLKKFKNARPARRITLAQENGFETIEAYRDYLESKLISKVDFEEKKPAIETKIHYVDILDMSGSMSGAKIASANDGIRKLCAQVNADPNAEFYSLFTFGSKREQFEKSFQVAKEAKHTDCRAIGYATALYYTLVKVLTKLDVECSKTSKVLINIYTDGGDNESSLENRRNAASLIKKLQNENFTITFVGTAQDVDRVKSVLSIDDSNTLVYDGTGQGLANTMAVTLSARAKYSKKVALGEDVSKGFYKSFNK